MLQYRFVYHIEGLTLAGATIKDAFQFRIIPEEEIHPHHILHIDKVTGLLSGFVAFPALKQLDFSFYFILVIHLENHAFRCRKWKQRKHT